ncbi:hypothetical protein AMS68_006943 [Peltaster fructicola]|uniref:Uncharacterized protein n=1 Tax=Peltaster fructicola TaxID=286661 RepID=A0A6H0Y3A0_9PEZI|nr:hypothetical protein AMS68_006943 [Peltaster fructicola]
MAAPRLGAAPAETNLILLLYLDTRRRGAVSEAVKDASISLMAAHSSVDAESLDMPKDVHQRVSTTSSQDSELSNESSDDKHTNSGYWPLIATKDQIPAWLRDNDFIITGHPMPTYSYARSFRLWRCLHMETMNIWTHLLGSAGFVVLGLSGYALGRTWTSSTLTPGDRFAFGLSLTSAALCFGLSTTFHTLRSHSYHVHHFWGKMDIFGICILALGGGMSATYYAWTCQTRIRNMYWALNACAAAAAGASLSDTGGGGSKMRTLRGSVFTLLAISAMLPIVHRSGNLGWTESCRQFGVQWFLGEVLALLVGVSLFVGRVPERFAPGSFDIWFHSHQLFHTFAVIGTVFHVVGLNVGLQYKLANPGC